MVAKTDPIRNREDIQTLKNYFLSEGRYRDYAMVIMAINIPLRIEALLELKWKDVWDDNQKQYFHFVNVKTRDAGGGLRLPLNQDVMEALTLYRENLECFSGEDYILKSRVGENRPINRTRAYRIVKQAAERLGIQGNISMLSLRKTIGYHAWEQGYEKDAIMSLYHHPSLEYTMEYLGIEEGEDTQAQQLLENIRI